MDDETLTYMEAETLVDMVAIVAQGEGLYRLSEDSRDAVCMLIDSAKAFEALHKARAAETNLDMEIYWDMHDYYDCVDLYVADMLDERRLATCASS